MRKAIGIKTKQGINDGFIKYLGICDWLNHEPIAEGRRGTGLGCKATGKVVENFLLYHIPQTCTRKQHKGIVDAGISRECEGREGERATKIVSLTANNQIEPIPLIFLPSITQFKTKSATKRHQKLISE